MLGCCFGSYQCHPVSSHMHFLHTGENTLLAVSMWYEEWRSQVIQTTLGEKKYSQSQWFAQVGLKEKLQDVTAF